MNRQENPDVLYLSCSKCTRIRRIAVNFNMQSRIDTGILKANIFELRGGADWNSNVNCRADSPGGP